MLMGLVEGQVAMLVRMETLSLSVHFSGLEKSGFSLLNMLKYGAAQQILA